MRNKQPRPADYGIQGSGRQVTDPIMQPMSEAVALTERDHAKARRDTAMMGAGDLKEAERQGQLYAYWSDLLDFIELDF